MNSMQIAYSLLTYLIGAIPFGVVVSQVFAGQDIRKQGSGNTGATNVARVLGKKWGILVLCLDAMKGYVLVIAARRLGGVSFQDFVGLVAILGHCYPVYLKFKGGKGVATALGVVAALSPTVLALCAGVFFAIMYITRRVSAGSLAAALALPLFCFFVKENLNSGYAALITLVVWWKHRSNLERLYKGTEPRFFR